MKILFAIISLILFCVAAAAQTDLPVIKSNVQVISIRNGKQLKTGSWTLSPDLKPDIYEAELIDGKAHKVTFITDVDEITFLVEEGKSYDFVIQRGEDRCFTRIVGTRLVPAAVFDKKYRETHRGRTFVEVPEVYELVNVAIAMTRTGLANKDLVYQRSEYYAAMRKWFDPFQDHPLLAALDQELQRDSNRYFPLKMNGYAFEFDANGEVVRSSVYNRTGFNGDRTNTLLPYLEQLRSFATATRFREFYRTHLATYREQIAFFESTANIAEMNRWLDRNFPSSRPYNSYKIVFSPLVAYNQSTTWFDSNGFKELQPHVNFPYREDLARYAPLVKLSPESETIFRGNIVFTEINHGYINPEADKYAAQVARATSNRALWVDPAKGPNYYTGMGLFNEYLNWALVTLRIADLARKEDQPGMIRAVEEMMVKRRGFRKFAEFDQFLLDRYLHRTKGKALADLYPQIIEWFDRENGAAK